MATEYPKEFIIDFEGPELEFIHAVLSVDHNPKGFFVEINLVQKESGKIYRHIDILYNLDDEREAVDAGVARLARYGQSS